MRALLGLLALLWAAQAQAGPVLMISLDGLRAADVAAMPALVKLRGEGMAASGVVAGWPSLTYPSHATLVTGASPAVHGIGGNEAFDATGALDGRWMWYADAFRADTLWAAARRAGRTSAAINWPVSVGAAIDWNLPQIWRSRGPEDATLLAGVATPGLAEALTPMVGAPYPLGSDPTCADDAVRARFAAVLMAAHHPDLTLVHLECLDHSQHDFGPGTSEARAALGELDRVVAKLVSEARQDRPDLTVVVVSDHGFASVHTAINLHAAFRAAGLEHSKWRAAPWQMAGTAAVVLRHPADKVVRRQVAALLIRLAADRRLGIAAVLRSAPGGTRRAAFWITFRPGFTSGGDRAGPLVQPAQIKGTHGYPPRETAMAASFIMAGPDIRAACKLGRIDMRVIAPTIARALRVRLGSAEQAAITDRACQAR